MKAPFDIGEGYYEKKELDLTIKRHLNDPEAEANVMLVCTTLNENDLFKIMIGKYQGDITRMLNALIPIVKNMAYMMDVKLEDLVRHVYSFMSEEEREIPVLAMKALKAGDYKDFLRKILTKTMKAGVIKEEDLDSIPKSVIMKIAQRTEDELRMVNPAALMLEREDYYKKKEGK